MHRFNVVALGVLSIGLSACGNLMIDEVGQISKVNRSIDQNPNLVPNVALEGAEAFVYVDGNGCEKWLIDDGLEGYMTTRFRDGKPYCPTGNTPFTVKGDFRDNRFPG